MEWQPIETAPEWEYVLAWSDDDEHSLAERHEDKWFDEYGFMCKVPTHWMPLPKPPQT